MVFGGQTVLQGCIVRENSLVVQLENGERREGENCGLFSIAAAYHAAKRDNIEAIVFNENMMRAHISSSALNVEK